MNAANRTYDSNGPDVKVRGTAAHIYDKYQALARDASSAGDRIAAENYLQHAEHYFRLMAAHAAAQQLQQQQQQPNAQAGNGQQPRANGQASDHAPDGESQEIDTAGGGNGGGNGQHAKRRQADETDGDGETAGADENAAETDEKTEEATA